MRIRLNKGRLKRGSLLSTTPNRSQLMGKVRRSGTAPELMLRFALHRSGLRYRLKGGVGLPGTPDIAFRRQRVALFVDGCFWHGCPLHGSMPTRNRIFWRSKIARNRRRDKEVDRALEGLGWRVLRFWEHDLKVNLGRVVCRVVSVLDHR